MHNCGYDKWPYWGWITFLYTTKCFHEIKDIGDEEMINGGNWNLVLKHSKDDHNYRHMNSLRARKVVTRKLKILTWLTSGELNTATRKDFLRREIIKIKELTLTAF